MSKPEPTLGRRLPYRAPQGMKDQCLAWSGAWLCGLLLLAAPAANGFDFTLDDDDLGGDFGDIEFSWNNRFTVGAQVRTESRDSRLIDKQNLEVNQGIPQSGIAQSAVLPPTLVTQHPLVDTVDGNPVYSGQFDLCELTQPSWGSWSGSNTLNTDSDCYSQYGNPRPGMRVHNAPGGYNINGDDGNLNYDKGDLTYANIQLLSELNIRWNDLSARISGIGYYDPVNQDFDTHLADRGDLDYWGRVNLGDTDTQVYPVAGLRTIDRSGFTKRQDDEEERLAEQIRLLEAWVAYDFDLGGGRNLQVKVGDQRLRWGESTFMIFNNLNRINPPSAELYDRPGTEVKDAFLPVGMVSASMNLTTNVNVEAFYQYDWEKAEPSVAGSFMSTSDVAGAGEGPTPVYLASGNAPEAPNAAAEVANGLTDFGLAGLSGTQTATSRTIYLEDQAYGYPEDDGQFGLRLDYYANWLNGGTEMSFYAMNIHSRLPFFSVNAAKCDWGRWDEPNAPCPHSANLDPGEYRAGTLAELNRKWRVDSMDAFLDYPEDIRVFGMSATTNLGNWSLAGELAYSPNQPAQVSVVDVVYAGVQPAFIQGFGSGGVPPGPYGDNIDTNWSGGGTSDGGSGVSGLRRTPVGRLSVPDYLMSQYRCDSTNASYDDNTEVSSDWENELACADAIQAGQTIRGYERLDVGQFSLTGIRMFSSSHPISTAINADSVLFVGEIAGTKVFDMPSLNQLQFQSAAASQTHYSQGQSDWTAESSGPFVAEDTDLDGNGTIDLERGDPIVNDQGELIDALADDYSGVNDFCSSDTPSSDPSGCYRKLGPADRLNPERADEDNFADDFAAGYRVRMTASYNDGWFGWSWSPGFTFYHDVHGNSIYPGQDFVEGRKRLTLTNTVQLTQNLSGTANYRMYMGAGDRNLRQDRDYAELVFNYSF